MRQARVKGAKGHLEPESSKAIVCDKPGIPASPIKNAYWHVAGLADRVAHNAAGCMEYLGAMQYARHA